MFYLQIELQPRQQDIIKKILEHGDRFATYMVLKRNQIDYDIKENHKAKTLLKITPDELYKIALFNRKTNKNRRGFKIWVDKQRLLNQHYLHNGGHLTMEKLLDYNDKTINLSREKKNSFIKKILFPIHPLSNRDIENYLKLLDIKGYVKPRDKLQRKYIVPNSCLVINLDNSNGKGTHWVCLVKPRDKQERDLLYYDSYGIEYMPEEVIKLGFKNIITNDETHQFVGKNSVLCGY